MKIKKVISLLCTAAMLLAVPAGNVYAQKTGTAGIFGYADAGGNRGVYGLQRAEGACDPSEKGNQILCEGDSWGIMAED